MNGKPEMLGKICQLKDSGKRVQVVGVHLPDIKNVGGHVSAYTVLELSMPGGIVHKPFDVDEQELQPITTINADCYKHSDKESEFFWITEGHTNFTIKDVWKRYPPGDMKNATVPSN